MADSIKDGGPAFPTDGFQFSHEGFSQRQGMTLRDWFAGQALAGFASTANEDLPMENGESVDEALTRHWGLAAKASYIAADAMLAAREARNA